MSEISNCPKCGSSKIVPQARIIDRGDVNLALPLQVAVERDPDSLIFKDRVYRELVARICGACGFTELYTTQPLGLYQAYLGTTGDKPAR